MGVAATLPELSKWTLIKKLVCRDISLLANLTIGQKGQKRLI